MNQSKYVNEIFERTVNKFLKPTLLNLDFERYELQKNWVFPTFLYKHKTSNLWFGTSYDWRDHYHEADLGRMFLFKDVMPRVVILGIDLNNNDNLKNNLSIEDFIASNIDKTNKSLINLLSEKASLNEIIELNINKKQKKLSNYLGEEVTTFDSIPINKYTDF